MSTGSTPDAVAVTVDPSPIDSLCLTCESASCDFSVRPLQRRPLGDEDVLVDMRYCGVCHSDLHTAAGHMEGVTGPVQYPMVPGHELAGVVAAIGSKVTRFAVGDRVGVGCMVDACLECARCLEGEEQKCKRGNVGTYGGKDKHGRAAQVPAGGQTLGGYTKTFVVHERFGVRIPPEFPLEAAGPVMCAGVTMYDPMRVAKVGPGSKVGIVGLGGLGQMGVKIAKALGCEVTVVSSVATKRGFAETCGADYFVHSEDAESMRAAGGRLDLLLNTVPVYHDYVRYRPLLRRRGGKQVILGLHTGLGGAMLVGNVFGSRSSLAASGIGGVTATQEVMDLCAKHDIMPDLEIVAATDMHRVYQALDDGNDSGRRYVLDAATIEKAAVRNFGPPPKLAEPKKRMSVIESWVSFLDYSCADTGGDGNEGRDDAGPAKPPNLRVVFLRRSTRASATRLCRSPFRPRFTIARARLRRRDRGEATG